jgi:hypothetical protein
MTFALPTPVSAGARPRGFARSLAITASRARRSRRHGSRRKTGKLERYRRILNKRAGVVSKFEDDLHKAVQDRADEAAAEAEATESFLRRFHDRNIAARIEAKRRLREIAADVSSFLTKRGVAPQQVVAGLRSGPDDRLRLVEVCQGWNFADYFFLVTTGQFCYSPRPPLPGFRPPGYVHELASEMKPGQLYLGMHTAIPQLVEYLLGVEEAVFVPEGQLPQTYAGDKFRTFYYGDLYRPGLPAPLPALLLPSAAPELWLASSTGTTDHQTVSVMSLDRWIAYEALQIEKRRATR